MPQLKVDSEVVRGVVEALRAAYVGIESDLDEFRAQMPRWAAAWSGEARDAYGGVQAKWLQEMGEMNRLLADAARRTANVSDRYIATRKAVDEGSGGPS